MNRAWNRDRGQGLAEYLILIVLVALSVLTFVRALGRSISNRYRSSAQQLAETNGPNSLLEKGSRFAGRDLRMESGSPDGGSDLFNVHFWPEDALEPDPGQPRPDEGSGGSAAAPPSNPGSASGAAGAPPGSATPSGGVSYLPDSFPLQPWRLVYARDRGMVPGPGWDYWDHVRSDPDPLYGELRRTMESEEGRRRSGS